VVRPEQHRRFIDQLLSAIPFHEPGRTLPFTWMTDPR